MSTDDIKAIQARVFDAINTHDSSHLRDVLQELVAEEYTGHAPGTPDYHGPDGFYEAVMGYYEALDNLNIQIWHQVAEGEWVVARYEFGGTHQGELAGVAPTGRELLMQAVSMMHVRHGKIIEEFEFWDNMDVLQQLGVEVEPEADKTVDD